MSALSTNIHYKNDEIVKYYKHAYSMCSNRKLLEDDLKTTFISYRNYTVVCSIVAWV